MSIEVLNNESINHLRLAVPARIPGSIFLCAYS